MKNGLKAIAFLAILAVVQIGIAQPCGPATVPTGLSHTIAPSGNVILSWDPVPGSIGAMVRGTTPWGTTVKKRQFGPVSTITVPKAVLSPGTYLWNVQLACSTTPPYSPTLISATDSFTSVSPACPASVSDLDGNSYSTVLIAGYCITRENLRTAHFATGDPIATGYSDADWSSIVNSAYAVYDDLPANAITFGYLYNWRAVSDIRNICPGGWHVPDDSEWADIIVELGDSLIAGGRMKELGDLGSGTGLWLPPNTGATNSSGFTGRPGGLRNNAGPYDGAAVSGYYWSSTPLPSGVVGHYLRLDYDSSKASRFRSNVNTGISVRCIKD